MNRYIEFRLLPDPEQAPTLLMSVLYEKLHLALAELGSGDVGVSFPEVEKGATLGTLLRLHGTAESLERLMRINWIVGMRDYVSQSAVMTVPAGAKYRRCYRVQAKSNPERLRRRMMRRHGVDAEIAARKIPDSARETLKLPYVQIKSRSSGKYFRLFFQLGPLEQRARDGLFSAYGLSREATIPWF